MPTKKKPVSITGPEMVPAAGLERLGLERLIFFSDAVFAIAITLLALEVRLPENASQFDNSQLLAQLLSMWPKYMGYIISFLVIGTFWVAHHRKFLMIKRYDSRLITFNLLILMVVAFIPFPSAVMSNSGSRTATIFYALTMMLGSILYIVLWHHAERANLIDTLLTQKQRKREYIGPFITSGIFLLSIGISYANTGLVRLLWILILPAYMFINRK
jgi:uncharacterized membrane protein